MGYKVWQGVTPLRGGKAYRQATGFKAEIRRRFNHICQRCGGPGRDVAHTPAYEKSGHTVPEEVTLLCHRCNCADRKPQKGRLLPLGAWWSQLEREVVAARVG